MDADPHGENCDRGSDRAAQPLPAGATTGARVRVRGRLWRLDAVTPHDDCRELHLTALGDHDSRTLLWPFDRPTPETAQERIRVTRSRAWLHGLRELAVSDRPAIHLLNTNGTTPPAILPYQLVPALEVTAGVRRVLLADEVGLGKTIQAGWIIANTMARERDARVLIAVPAGLRAQWARELARLFAIDTTNADARWLISAVNDLPPDMNVWMPPGVYLVSLDFLKRPDIAASAACLLWDLIVVDEAHVAAAPTERHRALEGIARRSRVVVLITATPFSGDETGFTSLMSLGGTPGAEPPRIFRRSRLEVGDTRRRRHRFAVVRLSQVEQRLQRMLHRYCREIWRNNPSAEGRLAAIVLRKRALSSPGALRRSLQRRLRLLSDSRGGVQLSLFGSDVDQEDDEPGAALAAPGLADAGRERAWLEKLIDAADRAGVRNSKLEYLHRLLRRIRGESVVVFTEFRDTLSDLADLFPSSHRLHGGMSAVERAHVQGRFNEDGGVLFATDAAAYGLNLHGCCRLVINFELPWNPARLEQRIGRVDRIGQTRPVHAVTLVARDTAEDIVIANLSRRLWRVAGSFGQSDRLAAFLDDARVAGMVVGGEPLVEPTVRSAPDRVEISADAIDESLRLERLTRWAARGAPRRRDSNDLEVSAIRTTEGLPPGVITVVRWTLNEPAGRLVASRTLALHTGGTYRRPRTAAAARAMALAFLASSGALLRARAEVEIQELRREARAAHGRATQRQIERETHLAANEARATALQPGLFDDRVVRGAAAAGAQFAEMQAETNRRITHLTSASSLEERFAITGVLIIWARA